MGLCESQWKPGDSKELKKQIALLIVALAKTKGKYLKWHLQKEQIIM